MTFTYREWYDAPIKEHVIEIRYTDRDIYKLKPEVVDMIAYYFSELEKTVKEAKAEPDKVPQYMPGRFPR